MARVLNDALSTCDRAGRKRRRGDFVLSPRVEDIAGGRLGSGGGDDERLRVQKRRYVACRVHTWLVSKALLCAKLCVHSDTEWFGFSRVLQAGAWGVAARFFFVSTKF